MFKWLEQYLTFTTGERRAVTGLMLLILLVVAVPRLYFYFKPPEHADNSKYLKEAERFARNSAANEEEKAGTPPETDNPKSSENQTGIPIVTVDSGLHIVKKATGADGYFNFDPNKIGVAEWVKLGFTEKQATTIEHYKQKGAIFYKAEDLKKLYVMTDEHYEKLLPYVQIDGNALPKRKYHRQ
jgi:hypothetical protein